MYEGNLFRLMDPERLGLSPGASVVRLRKPAGADKDKRRSELR